MIARPGTLIRKSHFKEKKYLVAQFCSFNGISYESHLVRLYLLVAWIMVRFSVSHPQLMCKTQKFSSITLLLCLAINQHAIHLNVFFFALPAMCVCVSSFTRANKRHLDDRETKWGMSIRHCLSRKKKFYTAIGLTCLLTYENFCYMYQIASRMSLQFCAVFVFVVVVAILLLQLMCFAVCTMPLIRNS